MPVSLPVTRPVAAPLSAAILAGLMTATEIEALITAGLPGAHVEVIDEVGDGNHWRAVIVTAAFAGKSLVERHQMVYGTLQGAMKDRIHALSIQAQTPEEQQRRS